MFLEPFLSTKQYDHIKTIFSYTGCLSLVGVSLEGLAGQLTERGDKALVDEYLTLNEQEHFQQFRFPKRKIEWLGGRIAAKAALCANQGGQKNANCWPGFSISQDRNGKPLAMSLKKQGPADEISITHSEKIAAALAAHVCCGLDMQYVLEKIKNIQERFINDQEKIILARFNTNSALKDIAGMTLLWSAKEALRKLHAIQPLPSLSSLRLIKAAALSFDSYCLEVEQNTVAKKVYCFFKGHYAGAITLQS